MKVRRLAVALAIPAMVVAACGSSSSSGGGGSSSVSLAADQTFRFPIIDDIKTLDPGHTSTAVDIAMVQNVFWGLYRFDDSLKRVPAIATGEPDVSADGKTYTFHLKSGVKFSNGDPVTASDFVYSWNRAARLNDSYGIVMQPVVGYDAVAPADPKAKPTATTLSGLSAPDPQTIVANLSHPAGYWLTELALWTAAVVDQKMIPSDTDKTWWTNAATAMGAGPFKLDAYVPKDHLQFSNVANWWGGSTGNLTKIVISVLADQASQVTKYQQGSYDAVGPADTYPPLDAVRNFLSNPTTKDQVLNIPGGRSTWVGFNFTTGPFAGYDATAQAGRMAFSLAIDRDALVTVACGPGGITCKAATGGVIPKGLQAYLGDGSDPGAKFDAAQAKTLLQQWDPTGTKRQGLVYWYNTGTTNKTIAENIQSQWQSNLGVHVDLQSTDFPTFLTARQDKKYIMFRDSWGADYDNPQDWFDNLFICSQAAVGLGNNDGICDKQVDTLVTKAESENGDQSIADFTAAGKQLQSNVAYAMLIYGANQYFIKPYVHGAGGNALYDNSWLNVSIGQH